MTMNEQGKNKREWVKTVAIIFLTILLILTFFSNTIMNYSLPEVAAKYVESGTITAKIRGTGTIESGDPYNVIVKESRKVQSVAVKAGDQVEKGDVLLYLEDTESDELKAAQDALDQAVDAYDVALLSADVNNEILNQASQNTPTASYRQQITNAQAEVAAAQKKVDEWQKKYDDYDAKINALPGNTANVDAETKAYNAAKSSKETADFNLTAVQNELKTVEAQLEYENSVSSGDAAADSRLEQLMAKKTELDKQVIDAQAVADNAQLNFDKAKTALDNKTATGDTTGTATSLQNQQKSVKTNLDAANKVLEAKTNALSTLVGNINGTLNLQNLYEAVVKAQKQVREQQEKSQNATVTADISGTISRVDITAGQTTTPDVALITMQPEGKGYTMSFSVTNEQAKRLSVGDRADVVNSWRYDDVQVTLASIKPDTTDPGQKKLLTFEVSGDVTAGQTLSVSVGQKSADYDLIVPNSAIREDNNGKFILIVESKSSPLGTRYTATRVDVEVLASDDTKSAISGGLYGYEFVITTSTKPVEAGKLVRLADN